MASPGARILKVGSFRPVLFSLRPLFLMWVLLLLQPSGLMAEEIPTLAVYPFWAERGGDPEKGVLCPVCRGIHPRGELSPGAPHTLTQALYEKMERQASFKMIPLEQVEAALSDLGKRPFENQSASSALLVGKTRNADFVMVGIVFRFEERKGSSIGVEKPASVGFDLHLFRVNDGKRVWDVRFDETQRPLSENLFQVGSFFRRKAKWLTAEELAEVGMEEQLQKLPGAKELLDKP